MEKSLALVLPDRPGALREVMRILESHDVMVLRVSYNRIIDIHTLFIDVSGTLSALQSAEEELRSWRFFPGQRMICNVVLLELNLGETLDGVETILATVERHDVNITYVDARTDGYGDGLLHVGVLVQDEGQLQSMMDDLNSRYEAHVSDKGNQHNMLDTNHFYLSFAQRIKKVLGLSIEEAKEILINSNRIMQNLISQGSEPFKPFDIINQIVDTIASYHGPSFRENCRITRLKTAKGADVVSIEPPVGSDTWVFECDECLLCVDGGYCCFTGELEGILRDLYPDWDTRQKKLMLTHADIDHMGACALVDEVFASGRVIDNFTFEKMGIVSWREHDPLGYPYMRIGSLISGYKTPDTSTMMCLGEPSPLGEQEELLCRIDTITIPPFSFEVWEGKGGHVRGETILIERTHRVCISGDIFVNVHGETKPQARYNLLAPALMTSVDTNPDLAREERSAMFNLLDGGTWQIMGGHGAVYEWNKT